jgi:hypothetical protein
MLNTLWKWVHIISCQNSMCVTCSYNFCLMCEWLIFKFQGWNFTSLTKKAYKLYFGCNVGDQDKTWAPHFWCIICLRLLTSWLKGSRSVPFIIPIKWRELKDHLTDCCFCLAGMLSSTVRSKHTVQYPNLQSAIWPVPCLEDLSVWSLPDTLSVDDMLGSGIVRHSAFFWALSVYTGSLEPAVFMVCLVYVNTQAYNYYSLHNAVWGCLCVSLFTYSRPPSFILFAYCSTSRGS